MPAIGHLSGGRDDLVDLAAGGDDAGGVGEGAGLDTAAEATGAAGCITDGGEGECIITGAGDGG